MNRSLAAVTVGVVAVAATTIPLPAAAARASLPAISSVSPHIGTVTGGTRVTLLGTGFSEVSAVKFGTAPGTAIHVVSSTRLQVTSPAHSQAVVHVRVQTSTGTSARSSSDTYAYRYPPAPPRALVVSDVTGTTVALTWRLPSHPGDTDRIEIHRRAGRTEPASPSAGTLVVSLPPGTTSFRDSGLSLASAYSYSAFAAAGALYSGPVSVLAHTSPTVRPSAPTDFTTQAQDAASCADPNAFTRGYVDIDRTAVTAHLSDPDVPTAELRLRLALADYGPSGSAEPVLLIRPSQSEYWSTPVSGDGVAYTRFWGVDLIDGHRYGVYGFASDGDHQSAPSAICTFWVDSISPDAPAISGDFPPDGTARVGSPATFTFTSSDSVPSAGRYAGIDHFSYSFSGCSTLAGDGGTHVTPTLDGPDATATITFTPTTWGMDSVCVQAHDRARNSSETSTYSFYVVG